eukprot:2680930-Lingulodinium_polyedra.AAC.1
MCIRDRSCLALCLVLLAAPAPPKLGRTSRLRLQDLGSLVKYPTSSPRYSRPKSFWERCFSRKRQQ